MGKGIDLARVDAPEHAAMMDDLKDQLILALIRRLGGIVEMPAMEIDQTGGFNLSLALDSTARVFTFKLEKKQ